MINADPKTQCKGNLNLKSFCNLKTHYIYEQGTKGATKNNSIHILI